MQTRRQKLLPLERRTGEGGTLQHKNVSLERPALVFTHDKTRRSYNRQNNDQRAQHPGTRDNYHQVTKQRRNKRSMQPRQTNKKKERKKDYHRLSVTSFFFPRFRDLLIHFERKIAFLFQTLFRFQSVINQAGNVTTSQRTNRTPEIRLEHIPSWSQANIYI